jgi:hypothetical protein
MNASTVLWCSEPRIRVKRDNKPPERLDQKPRHVKDKGAIASSDADRDEEASRVEKWLALAELRRPT